ncbi:Putative multidrug export ATP-binding/permease protein SAS1788 [Rhizoctonia solani AG-1 IB]|uniref:Putative multidrug export ATP-binding/permease protein SAS1788 n=1 Tax=Thanatephorus cucumeris (strain AG1-IB / isolate 7/3/14) TaxID=1108050 RepID=M5BP84_THACB|nr:Putative multidrug export ATP-binding/permease protein SAS1788 [Rhizoctonia solani AG-1 IB]
MTGIEKPDDVPVSSSKGALNEKPMAPEPADKKKPKRECQFREEQLGVWTLYYPITNSWREYLPALESLWVLYDMAKSLPIVWKFVLETLSLGPIFFTAYFISSTLVGFIPAFQLYNNSNTLAFQVYYAMVTDARWLRMTALFDLGTKPSYKKEIIADNLEEFVNSQYNQDRRSLGDTPKQQPYDQQSDSAWLTYSDFDGIFDALPLLAFAWMSLKTGGKGDLSSLVLIQQATSSLQQTLFGMIYGGNNIASLFKNVMSLYEVLELKPTMSDGDIYYPEERHSSQKGMTIEFKSVTFKYPMTDKEVLKDMSFAIGPGQLCVIVGENGCGKSTTINLITRMYDSTSGEVLIDGRPLKDFKLSTYRATTSVMYQDYQHLPLTIYENILLGRPDCTNPEEAVEEAARLGGAFDFVQKLPLKFETNLEPQQTGYVNTWEDDGEEETSIFQKFIDSQKATKLSGGEWQRLALSKSFMKNSEKIRLLCYDEPSASLDPKAEYEMFERLRQLRGGKTMIFVTQWVLL